MKISQGIGQKYFFLGEKYFQKGQEIGRVEGEWSAVRKMAGGVGFPGGGRLPAGRVELRGGSAIGRPSSQTGGFFYEFATSSS